MRALVALLLVISALRFLPALHAANTVAPPPLRLRVLYIGHRASEYEPELRKHFSSVTSISRQQLDPRGPLDFDVALLDWPQSDSARAERTGLSPLGARDSWHKPTVLLGSAGLNLAVAWKVKGGSG
ncbi:MAG: hypothetical protein AB1813_05185 [Verrucomicrobiota bacterium]